MSPKSSVPQAANSISQVLMSDTAYLYDWNIIPLGQILWLKELESYRAYPPMQDPETYNLDQVIQQIKEQRTTSHGGD